MNGNNDVVKGQPPEASLTLEDAKNIREFFSHFQIPWSEDMESVVSAFEKSPTYDNQLKLRSTIAREMATSDHDSFKDKMFTSIIKASEEVAYDQQFNKDLEEVLSTDKV